MQTNKMQQQSSRVSVLLACVKGRECFSSCMQAIHTLGRPLKKYILLECRLTFRKHLNSCINNSSVRQQGMIYLNVEIKIDLMCFLVGGFAFVYEAQDLGSGKDYALKVK